MTSTNANWFVLAETPAVADAVRSGIVARGGGMDPECALAGRPVP